MRKSWFQVSKSSFQVNRRVRSLGRSFEPLEDRLAMAVFTVLNTNDSGVGSLRSAITAANSLVGLDRIEFNIPTNFKKISLQTSLPWIEDTTVVDGTSQPGYAGKPLIELDGTSVAEQFASGLVVKSDNSTIRGLAINNFHHGIAVLDSSGTVIAGNHLGVDASGTVAVGNRMTGIYLSQSSDSLIGGSSPADRNIISGNGETGVRAAGNASTGNHILGNYIGTDVTGLTAIPNKNDGILIADGATRSIIGTDGDGKNDATEGNVIAGNLLAGVKLYSTFGNRVAGNRIGIGAGVHTPLGNGTDGVNISFQSHANTIGTNADGLSDSLEANVIASNRDNGIRVYFSRINHVSGNFIGLLADGVTSSPNLHSGILIDGSSEANVIGRLSPIETVGANVISSNGYYGIWTVDSTGDVIRGNMIGRTADNQAPMTNFFAGIRLTRSKLLSIGGVNTFSNTIGYSLKGLVVEDNSNTNFLDRNRYIGDSGLAIDLAGDGATPNDVGDVDTGSNSLQNFPEIESVNSDGAILGTIDSEPYRRLSILVYAVEPADNGARLQHRFLQVASVITDAQGVGTWFVQATLAANQTVTATATDPANGTSEFGARVAQVASRLLTLSKNNVAENSGSLTATVHRADSDPDGEVIVNLRSSDPSRASVQGQVIIPVNVQSVEIPVTIVDDQAVHFDQLVLLAETATASGATELLVQENDSPWHNYAQVLDVSGDGRLTSIDALLIINELNSGRAGSLFGRVTEVPPLYIDVNGDGNVTAFDALLVINALNSGSAGTGEGEGQALAAEEPLFGAPDSDWLSNRKRATR